MAKTWDKLLFNGENKILKLHQKCDRIKDEQKAVADEYEKKTQRALDRFVASSNRSLSGLAYQACDKTEYANRVMAKKLQRYDVSHYMTHRRINHGTARAIFKAVKDNRDFTSYLGSMRAADEKMAKKRESLVKRLEAARDGYAANKTSDSTAYDAKLKELELKYTDYSASVTEKYASASEKKQANLQKKYDAVSAKIDARKAKSKKSLTLPDDVLLSVKGLKMYFGGLKAVDDLSFDVKRGEIFGLIGPNGAGKTTVFNCITRFYNATGGDMHFRNKYGEVVDLRNYKVHDIILQGISRTFQNIELVKEISVIENLLVAATRYHSTGIFAHAIAYPKIKKEEKLLREKAMRILKFMGIENYAHWLTFGLPYGILKKVEIARALMADAQLIIMDEPAAGLNDSETRELTKTIGRIRDEFGATILLVEHDMSLVMNVCDTVCAISFGQMLAIGTTEEIQKNKAVQEAYLGVEDDE